MNNIEELREHCEEMITISRMQYAHIPASSIITLIDRIEKAEKESKQWYSVVEAAISDDAEWRKQSNTASEAIGYLTTGIVMLKERAEKAEAELSAANEKLSRHIVVRSKSGAVAYRYKLKNDFCRWAYSDGIPPNKSDKFQEELLFTHPIRASIELPDVELGKYWFEHDGRNIFDGVEFNNDVISAIKAAGFTVEGE